jgi:hypothetical protein
MGAKTAAIEEHIFSTIARGTFGEISQNSISRVMGVRISRLAPSVTATTHVASPSSTAATPPQFLAAQKASAVIDASRRALLDNAVLSPKDVSNPSSEDAFVSGPRSARLQDALGRGGGGGHDGEGGAVTQEQLRSAYSMQMVLKAACSNLLLIFGSFSNT